MLFVVDLGFTREGHESVCVARGNWPGVPFLMLYRSADGRIRKDDS